MIFDQSIPDQEKDEFTDACKQLLEYLKPDKKLTYYIHSAFYTSVKGDAIYFNYCGKDFDRLNLTIYTLAGITGYTLMDTTTVSINYGVLYRYAVAVNTGLGWQTKQYKPLEQTKAYLKNNPYILDMEYPQFLADFATDEEIAYTESAAKYFMEYLKNEYGSENFFELCEMRNASLFLRNTTYTNAEANKQFGETMLNYKKEWLNSIGITAGYDYCPDYYYTLNHSRKFPFIIETDWVNHYFIKEFGNTYMPYELNYTGLKNYIGIAETEMQKVRDFLDSDKKQLWKPASTYLNEFDTEVPKEYSGYTTRFTNEIFVLVVQAFIHEYSHSISIQLYPYAFKDWLIEGLASYCDMLFSTLFYDRIVQRLQEFETYKDVDEFSLLWYRAYLAYSNEEYNLFDWNDLYVFLCNIYYPDAFNEYRHGCSFTSYLIEKYGKEKYLAVYDADAENIFFIYGKTLVELEAEWMEYINQKFNGFWQEYLLQTQQIQAIA